MAYQADSGQLWPRTGSFPSDGDYQPLVFPLLDIGTPPDLGGSLNSPDASSSDLHSSIQRSTMLSPMSDIGFASDNQDLMEGNPSFNTGAERPPNPMFGDVTSAGVSAPELRSINPILLLRKRVPEDDTSPSVHHHESSEFTPVNASSEIANGLQSHMTYLNTFDLALRQAEMSPDVTELNLGALSFIAVWMLLNPGQLPSTTDLKSIENLAHAHGKGKLMMGWLKNNLRQWGDETRYYRPKCVSSSQRENQSGESKLFTCTNRCGKTFNLKHSWARHERNNFEEWVCYVCNAVLTRDSHLEKHLKSHPNTQSVNLEKCKRQFLAPMDRPCGFCGKRFPSWEEWLAHVGAHFEGLIQDKVWKIFEWKERGPTAPQSNAHSDFSYAPNDGDVDQNQYSDSGSGENNDGNGAQPAYSMQDTGAGCESGSSPAVPNQTSNHYHAYTALQGCASQQEAVPQQPHKEAATIDHSLDHVPYDAPDDHQENDHDFIANVTLESTHDLAHRMTSLYISKMGNQRESLHDTTATEYSCSCADCTKRLHFEIPAVPTDPHARNGGCRRFGGPIYSPVQRYLDTPPHLDPFSVWRLTRSTPLPTRLQPILIRIEELPPVNLRSVL